MDRGAMLAFVAAAHKATMVTVKPDGTPHSVPVMYALDGETILISGTASRVRTRYLRRDPRCVLTVFADHEAGGAAVHWFRWVTVEGRAEVRTENAPQENLRVYEMITGRPPDDVDEYLEAMVREERLIYAVTIDRWYPT